MNNNLGKILLSLIKERRSVRLFNGRKVLGEDILSIIESGTWAPTGCNNQELRFLILDKKQEINEFLKFKPFLKGISAVVLVFCDMSLPQSHETYSSKGGKNLPYIDTGLALANMVTYAKSKGIDSCIVNLSEYHFGEREKGCLKRIIKKIKAVLGFHTSLKNNFEFYLRNQLKVPNHLKIMCGVVFGFAERYPDVTKEMHGGRKVMREEVKYYIVHKG